MEWCFASESETSEKETRFYIQCELVKAQGSNQAKPLTQPHRSNLTRDISLTNEFAQLQGSHLHENNLLTLHIVFSVISVEMEIKSSGSILHMANSIPFHTVKMLLVGLVQ